MMTTKDTAVPGGRSHFLILPILLCLCCGFIGMKTATANSDPGARGWKERLRVQGEIRLETAYRIASPRNFSKIKQFQRLDLKYTFNDVVSLKLGGRLFLDYVYAVTDQFPQPVNDNMIKEVALRDAYLNISLAKWNLRLGHQQIVWGEALGQFFADVVMPKDLREFLLPEFADVRLPIWAFDIQYFFASAASLELVLSPDRSVHKLALPGADFAFFSPAPPGINVTLLDDNRPKTNFKNWNGGLRLVSFIKGWDLSGFYYTSADHPPALHKTLSINPVTGATELTLDPRHQRVHHIGSTFSKGIEPIILRGELVYTLRRLFNAEDITQNDGLVRGDHLRYVIGLDYPIAGQVDMNAEFQQEYLIRPNRRTSDQRVRSWLFFHFSTGFFNESLRPELTFIVGLDGGDTQISPHLHYQLTDSLTLSWGADLFTGPEDGLYGEFDGSDRVFMNTRFQY